MAKQAHSGTPRARSSRMRVCARFHLLSSREEGATCADEELGAPAYPCGFTATLCREPPSGVFCCRCSSRERIVSSLLSVRPFRFPASHTRVLWPLLTPVDSTVPSGSGYEVTSRIPQASPDKNVIFLPATTQVYRGNPWRLWISSCVGDSSDSPCLELSSCTLARAFASSFLQIPPRDGHPCSWLTVGVRQPPFGTLTLEMTPMLGVQRTKGRRISATLRYVV